MSRYYIGVDFGTANTKVCVREEFAQIATAVAVHPTAQDAGRYLLQSAALSWTDRDPPKVILLSQKAAVDRDHAAMNAAIDVVLRAARTAVEFVTESTGTNAHDFVLNLGYPSVFEADKGDVEDRYSLIATDVVTQLARELRLGATIRVGSDCMDERSAALVHLSKSRYELGTAPMFLVDGGGYTLHMTIVRWRAAGDWGGEEGLSVHGASTRLHGTSRVVGGVLNAVDAVRPGATPSDAATVIESVLRLAYEHAEFSRAVPGDTLSTKVLADQAFTGGVIERARNSNVTSLRGRTELLVKTVLSEFDRFVSAPIIKDAWLEAWESGWKHSAERRFWATYPLMMMGGACRAGRQMNSRHRDPLSAAIRGFPPTSAPGFTSVLYPELDESFGLEGARSPSLQAAMPFLFVSAGYTHPKEDWPVGIRPETVPKSPVSEVPPDPYGD